MIKNYKETQVPNVELGNLGLHNASSYYVNKDPKGYPIAWFAKKTKDGERFMVYASHPKDCPKGYKIKEQYDNPMERLVAYADDLKSEHSDLSDERIAENPKFLGHKRSMRWDDERRRRGLAK